MLIPILSPDPAIFTLPWRITQPATSLLFQMDVRSKVTGQRVTVNWGDGSSNIYTLSSTVDTAIAHTYAGAAVYNITIAGASNIVRLTSTYTDGRSNWGADITSRISLTYLAVGGSNTLSGSVAALTSLTYLAVGGGLNTITWAVGPLTALATLNASNNALSQAQVDAILLAMYTARAGYTNAAPAATLGGTNAAPSGVYADEDPPVTGKGMAYELVNDPEVEGFKKWAITFTA